MPRKDDSRAIVDHLERDPRLRAMSLASRMLWFALVRAMQSLSVSVLRFGSHPPSMAEIALLVSVSETELKEHLEPLIARGLIGCEADGALSSPFLLGVVARSEVNRLNGLKGGAVRRAQAEARRAQTSFALPIAGEPPASTSLADSEPEANSLPVSVPAGPKLKLKDSESKLKLSSADQDSFHRIGRQALEAAEFDPARSMANYGIVRQWLADGATEEMILDTIRAAIAKGAKPQHLGYFTKAIRETVARGGASGGSEPTARSMAWEYALGQWRLDGKRGRMPVPSDFRADGLPVAA